MGLAAIAIIQPQVTQAQSIEKVAEIAEKITVKIESPGDEGSGVIVARDKNTYYVLTARHVIKDTHQGENLYIFTDDNKQHKTNLDFVQNLPNNLDLSLIKFTSDRDYQVATISQFNYQLYRHNDYEHKSFSDASPRQYVFVSGWPAEIAKPERVFNPGFLFDDSASAVSSAPYIASEDNLGGYELTYTNLTHPGMSGGPVLDTQGRLIAIHGRGDGRYIDESDTVIKDYLDEVGSPARIKIGLSLGIPVKNFLLWSRDKSFRHHLHLEDTPPPSINLDLSKSWRPPVSVKDPNDAYHWLEKGNQLWRIGRVSEARGAFDKAIQLRKDLYLAWFAKGFASGFDEKYDLALAACNKAIELQVRPSHYKYEAYRCRSNALQALQRFEPALDSLNKALEINSHNNADWMIQGELRYALGQYRGAIESLNRAEAQRKIQYLPPSALLHSNRGMVWLELQKYEAALKDIEIAIDIDPQYSPAWGNKGLVLETLNKNTAALDAYNHALKLSPHDYALWTNKAFVLYKLEQYTQAQASLEKAIQINANYQPAIDSLAQLKLVMSQSQ